MRIRTRVKIGGALTVCVLLAYGATILYLDRTMSQLAQEIREANEIVNKITILRSLTQDFLLYRTERAQRQWSSLYDEVLRLLDNPEYRVLKGEYALGDSQQKLKVVGDTFFRLMSIQPSAGPGNPEGGASDELRNRLSTQLLLSTQDLLTRFFNLNETLNGKLIATQRFIFFLDILALLVLGTFVVSNLIFLQRSVVKPVLKLQAGAAIIGAGNLDYKVGIDRRDEVGQLSRAFDKMTASLKQVTVSRDDLSREVEVRRRFEEALHKSVLRLDLLAETAGRLLAAESPQQVVESLCRKVCGFLDCDAFFNFLVADDQTGIMQLNASAGIPEDEAKKIEWLEYGVAVCGCAARDGCRIVAEDIQNNEDPRTALVKSYGIQAYACHPLIVQERVLGTLSFGTRKKTSFSPDELALMKAVADQVAIAMERKRVEAEVKRLASFPQMNPAPVLETDLSGAITFYNQAALEAVETLGPEADLAVLIPGDLGEITKAIIEKQEKVFYREVRIKDKAFSQNIYFAEPFQVLRFYSMDITERQRAEEALKDSEERFRAMANAIPQLAWMARGDGYIYWYNQRWYDYTGTTPKDMEGWGWQSVHDPEVLPQVLERWLSSIASGRPFDMVFPLRGTDGQFRQFLTRVMPMKNAYGQVVQWFGTNTDITERQQAEKKLQRTLADLERSNLELEQFAYISSHDLQEPLRKIANFADMLVHQYQGRLDEQAERYFGYITDGAKRMQALINDLLSYSRVGRAEMPLVPASLEEILKGVTGDLQALIQECSAEISHDPLPTLKVNPHQMGRLLQNLIANGIKFHCDGAPRIHLSARREGREWVIAVRDNGIGFDCQYAENIFKVFKRLHAKEEYPGTGIGLAICKKIVERHGGRIWAESEPGQGSTFYFTIPA